MTAKNAYGRILILQSVQMQNSPKSEVWQEASRQLVPLFAFMAEQQKLGNLTADGRPVA